MCYVTQCYLAFKALVSTYQQLLTGLTGSVESSLYLCTTEMNGC